MKKLFFLSLLIAVSLSQTFLSQIQFCETIGAARAERAESVTQTSDGGYIAVGTTTTFGAYGIYDYDAYMVKVDASGAIEWTSTFGGDGIDYLFSVIQTSDGGYAMAGESSSDAIGSFRSYILKVNSTGVVQWNMTYGNSGYNEANSIIETSDGNIVVTGKLAGTSSLYGTFLLKISSTGTVIWNRTFGTGSGGQHYGAEVIETSDGGLALVGVSDQGQGAHDFHFIKLNASGVVQWDRTIGGASGEIPYSLIQTTDGGYAMCGYTQSYGAGGLDMYVVKISSTGTLQWTRALGGTAGELAYSIVQATDGGYVVSGFTSSYGLGSNDIYIVKLNSSGVYQWAKTAGDTGNDLCYDGINTADGGYLFVGGTRSFGEGFDDMYFIKTNASGVSCCTSTSTTASATGGVIATPSIGTLSETGTFSSVGVSGVTGGVLNVQCMVCAAETNTTATTPICESQTKPLTSSGGGGGTWSVVSGGGTISGTTYTPANISSATTVTVRYVDGCGTGTNISFTVNAISNAPTSITGTTTICSGSSTTLSVSGGQAGTGATVQWFTSSCGGTAAGTGNSISVSPTTNTTYYVRYSGTCNTTTCVSTTVNVNSNSTAPTGTTGTTNICSGASTTLTVDGGSAGTGATAQWFTSSCGGTAAGTGNSITVSPTTSTTYYVRYSGTCNTTTCASTTVNINSNSTAPTGTTGTTNICSGASTTLTVDGGSAGTGATAQWFTSSCGGTAAGTGNSITVSPTTSTTYYVRYSGTCNTTTCANTTVNINSNSTAPTGITGTKTICSGASTTLTIAGGSAGTGASIEWFTGSCGGTAAGTGNSITVSPTANTIYYARYSGTCNTTSCISTTVNVNSNSTAPTGITGTKTICSGASTTLTIAGGSAGTGASIEWFTGSCGGTATGTGSSITVSPTANTIYYARYTGTCNTTSCISTTVNVNSNSTAPTGITGTITICSGASTTLTVDGGSAGTGATAQWFTSSCGGTAAGTGNSISVSPTENTIYYVRYSGTCNTTTCASTTVNVNTSSTAPTGITGTKTICSGASTTLTIAGGSAGTGASIEWFTGSCGGTAAGTGNSITVSPTANTIYYARYTGTCNTTTCVSTTVNVNTNSTTPTSITGTTTICSGAPTTLTLDGGSAGTGATAQWFTSSCGGTTAGTGNSITVSPTENTIYYVRYSGTCNTTVCESVSVTVNPIDDATFTYSGSTFCLTGSDPTPTITGLTGGTFSVTNGGAINASSGVLDLDANGVNNYTVTYLTAGACPSSTTFLINVTSAPSAGFSYAASPYCNNGANPTVTFSPSASGGVFTDQGTTGNLTINGSTGEIDLSASMPGTYTIENNIVASGGCAAANATTSVTITPADNAGYNYSGSTYCLSGTDPTPSITGTTGGNFTSLPTGLSINAVTGEIDLSTSTPNTYAITYTTPNTCFTDSIIQLTITNAPTADFSYPNALYCQDNGGTSVATVTFNPGASGGVFKDQGTSGNLTINSATGEIDLAASLPGTYIVENDIVAAGGCAAANATSTITITQQDDPSFSYSSTSFCQSVTNNPLATITGTLGGNFTSVPTGLVIDGTTGEIDIATSTLDVTYTITYTTAGTCPDSEDATLIINSTPTTPTVGTNVTGSTICEGETIDITASGSGTNITYNIYDAITGGNLLGVTDFNASPMVTTDYYIEAINTNGCTPSTGREVVTITVNPLPSIDAGTDETICPGDIVTLSATGTGTFTWSTSETTANIDVSPTVTTTYTVTITDANMCVNSDLVDVNVNAVGSSLSAVDDNYSVDFETLTNLNVLANDTYGNTITTVIIDPINGLTNVQADGSVNYSGNPTYTGSDSFTYMVCEVLCTSICDTALVSLTIENNDIGIPGGFSPNDDNINDIFVINGLSAYPNNNLQIFNRWGSLIFKAEPYNNDWDGSSSEAGVILGDKVTTGTYFYILELGDGNEAFKGSIEVKR